MSFETLDTTFLCHLPYHAAIDPLFLVDALSPWEDTLTSRLQEAYLTMDLQLSSKIIDYDHYQGLRPVYQRTGNAKSVK